MIHTRLFSMAVAVFLGGCLLNAGCTSSPVSASPPTVLEMGQYIPAPNDGVTLVFKAITPFNPALEAEQRGQRRGAMIGSVAGQVAGTLVQVAGVIPGGAIAGIVASTVIGAASTAAGEAIGGSAVRSGDKTEYVTADVCRLPAAQSSEAVGKAVGKAVGEVSQTPSFLSSDCMVYFLKIKNAPEINQLKAGDKVLYIHAPDGKPTLRRIE